MKKTLFLLFMPLGVAFGDSVSHPTSSGLESGFVHPPDSARPQAWWHWMNGNVTEQGIIADLEAMKRIGLGGGQIFSVSTGIPTGLVKEVPYFSEEWRRLVGRAAEESSRLGLELSALNGDGWTGGGGPWITPDNAMQRVTWSQTQVEGTGARQLRLAQPPTKLDYYRDIAVLAFPAPGGEAEAGNAPRLTINVPGAKPAPLADGNNTKRLTLKRPASGEIIIQWDFPAPFAARSITLEGLSLGRSAPNGAELQVSADGKSYRPVCAMALKWKGGLGSATAGFAPATGRFFRLVFRREDFGGGNLSLSEVRLSGADRVHYWEAKAGFIYHAEHGGGAPMFAERLASIPKSAAPQSAPTPDEAGPLAIPIGRVVDLTGKMDASGKLDWDVPEGRWTVLRIGYTPTGKTNHPATKAGLGLECDKLSPRGIEAQFNAMMAKLLDQLGPLAGKTFTQAVIDSWELGEQNWTPAFRDEFKKRRGYDPLPWLPVMAGGAIVGDRDRSERFLWDLRRTIADLIADNFYGRMTELCHERGIRFQGEPGGRQQYMYDPIVFQKQADVPMGEFWVGGGPRVDCRAAASAAHVYGKPIVAAESFTAGKGRWEEDPFALKALGDRAFCLGINRYVFHRYAMQPWLNLKPGMTMGPYGINLERTNTWWEPGAAWIAYVTRCQHLLQQGRFVADVIHLIGEGAPCYLGWSGELSPPLPPGYDYDGCDAEAVARLLSVKDGRLVTPSGMSYRMLLLPNGDAMTPALVRKVRDLVRDGALVVGPRPTHSPSLADYPLGDEEVRGIAKEVWADCDGQAVKEHAFGKGRVVWGKSFAEIASALNLAPDFEYTTDDGQASLLFIHRRTEDADIYFVSNQEDRPVEALCAFRVAGKAPELWRADVGTITRAAVYEEQAGRTRLPIRFDPCGSVFVVFREPSSALRASAIRKDGKVLAAARPDAAAGTNQAPIELERDTEGRLIAMISENGRYTLEMADGKSREIAVNSIPAPLTLGGAWELHFPPNWGAPETVRFDRLMSWTEHGDPGVRFFSGTATYIKDIEIPAAMLGDEKALALDLGRVRNLAQVRLNDRDLGVLWKPPFRVDTGGAAKPGANHLEIRITNLWPNRLIGDAQAPDDCEWTDRNSISAWPSWVSQDGPRPTDAGRYTFTTWKHYTADAPLLESGLLGPVVLRSARRAPVR